MSESQLVFELGSPMWWEIPLVSGGTLRVFCDAVDREQEEFRFALLTGDAPPALTIVAQIPVSEVDARWIEPK